MKIARKMCEENIFQFQSMSNVITLFAVKNSGVYGLNSIFNLSNQKMKIKRAKDQFKFARYNYLFSFILHFFQQMDTNLWLR